MAKYYGVQRSEEYLMHYGIKGMKWGVRKAIAEGGSRGARRLDRAYKKASKKLAKLNRNADLNYQAKTAKKYGKIAKVAGSIGAAGLGVSGAAHLGQKANWKHFDRELETAMRRTGAAKKVGGGVQMPSQQEFVFDNKLGKQIYGKHYDVHNRLGDTKILSGGVGALGTAVALGTGAKAAIAKHRTTTGGHAAAVAKRNEWQREMNKAFAGTKYASGARHSGKRRKNSK